MASLEPPPPPPLASSSTPKRKRDQLSEDDGKTALVHSTSIFPFELPPHEVGDGNSSPRTKITRKFQDLTLGAVTWRGAAPQSRTAPFSATAVVENPTKRPQPSPKRAKVDASRDHDDDVDGARRVNFPNATDSSHGNSPAKSTTLLRTTSVFAPIADAETGDITKQLAKSSAVDTTKTSTMGAGKKSAHNKHGPSIFAQRMADVKSWRKHRTGTPPLVATKTTTGESEESDEVVIVDSVRAALTWHEDEITVYDPEDEDDDGTGLNGIGFRPTPAVAYARTLKRRQALADYRKREEREARARRNLRRRMSPGNGGAKVGQDSAQQAEEKAEQQEEPPARRVRFMEIEPTAIVTTS